MAICTRRFSRALLEASITRWPRAWRIGPSARNDMCRTEQARPEPGQPHHQGPVTAAQSKARRRTPQGDAELMAEEQVLDFKPARRLEEVDDKYCKRMQGREHRRRSCDDSTRRGDSQAGWNIRKAQGLSRLAIARLRSVG